MFQDSASNIPLYPPRQVLPVGQRFGRLVVVGERIIKRQKSHWPCKCDCGNSKVVYGYHLTTGKTASCGCYGKTHAITHGRKNTQEWDAWKRMRQRCYVENTTGYEYYGGRGITVCDRWLKGENGIGPFECFFADMGLRPSPKHSLDRKDNEKNYTPENCHWATKAQQVRNRRNTRTVIFNGRTISLGELAEMNNLNWETLYSRIINCGWSVERALMQGDRKCS